jgi:HlyD family secretion protein
MKRLVAFLVFAVIAGVVALLLTTLPANHETIFPGYMEADLVLVGSEQGGRVETLSVDEGDSVEKDAPIFTLESTEQIAEVAAAKARVAEAEARLADARQQMQRDRGAGGLARPGQRHAGAIQSQPRPHAEAVRQELGFEGPA